MTNASVESARRRIANIQKADSCYRVLKKLKRKPEEVRSYFDIINSQASEEYCKAMDFYGWKEIDKRDCIQILERKFRLISALEDLSSKDASACLRELPRDVKWIAAAYCVGMINLGQRRGFFQFFRNPISYLVDYISKFYLSQQFLGNGRDKLPFSG